MILILNNNLHINKVSKNIDRITRLYNEGALQQAFDEARELLIKIKNK
jgi:hypothetical protein